MTVAADDVYRLVKFIPPLAPYTLVDRWKHKGLNLHLTLHFSFFFSQSITPLLTDTDSPMGHVSVAVTQQM